MKLIQHDHVLLKFLYQPRKGAVMYLCVMGIDLACFYDCCFGFCTCSGSVVLFVFHFVPVPAV